MKAHLDPVIHPIHRLQICAMLDAGTKVEMAVLKDALGLSASALSKQVAALVDAGYAVQERSQRDGRRTWLTLTKRGNQAYQGHVRALRAIVAASAALDPMAESASDRDRAPIRPDVAPPDP